MANYKYENGKYYRQSLKGDWFEVLRNKDGFLAWTLPDGRTVYDNTFKVPVMMQTSSTPIGTMYTIGVGANGSLGRYFSFKDAANAYTKAVESGLFSDPSENILNDLMAGGAGITRKLTTQGINLIAKTISKGSKTAWNTGKKLVTGLITKESAKEATRLAVRSTAQTIVKQTPKVGVSIATGKVVDRALESLTGKSWGENVAAGLTNHWGFKVSPTMGDFTNPGNYLGYNVSPIIGKIAWKPFAEDLTPRVYKYVSPSGYFNSKLSRWDEVKNIAKSFLKREKINIDEAPEWTKNGIGATTGKGYNVPYLSSEAETLFRDDAFRKYLGLSERSGHNLYLDNGDGTWSYNNDYVQAVRRKYPTAEDIIYNFGNRTTTGSPRKPLVFVESSELGLPLLPGKSYLAGDFLTGNGGRVSYTDLGNGTSKMFDVWDVRPFSDPKRLGNGIIGRVGNYLFPDFELSTVLGKNAKPFTMSTTFVPEGVPITIKKP